MTCILLTCGMWPVLTTQHTEQSCGLDLSPTFIIQFIEIVLNSLKQCLCMYVTKNLLKLDIFSIKKCSSFFSLGKATFLSLSTSSSEKNTRMTCCWSFHCFFLLQNILSLCFCLSLRIHLLVKALIIKTHL